jgi:uncharacterized protein HemX
MALFIRQTDDRSKLQERLAAELQERNRVKNDFTEAPDGVKDSSYMKGTKEGSSLLGVWLIVGALAVGLVIWLTIQSI